MSGVKQVRNKKLLPDLNKEGRFTKDIVLSTKEKHGVPTGSRLFSHHTLASVRKLNFYHPLSIPEDSLDIVLAATYDHSKEHFADKEDLYLQCETLGIETWRRLRNTIDKQPPVVIPLGVGHYKILFIFQHKEFKGPPWSHDLNRCFLDPDSNKKAKQVQSWYLYEQYKSLESNQSHANKALKERSCQKSILQQELRERRARRRFCNQFGTCSSEYHLPKGVSSDTRTLASASTDDFIDSLCDVHASEATIVNSDHTYNLSFEGHHRYDELDCKILNYGADIDSDEKEVESSRYSDVQDCSELIGANVVENGHALVEPTQQLKPIVGDTAEGRSLEFLKRSKTCKMSKNNGFPAVWSTLVTFAYQLLRLNPGNYYYDYTSQLMAAVLACDFLCRGFSKMCNILQPYVTPVKFDTDDTDFCNDSYTKTNCKRLVDSKCIRRKLHKSKSRPTKVRNKKYTRNKQGFENNLLDNRANDRKLNTARSSTNMNSISCETFIKDLEDYTRRKHYCNHCYCHRSNYIGNPMNKLCRYIDSIIQDLEE